MWGIHELHSQDFKIQDERTLCAGSIQSTSHHPVHSDLSQVSDIWYLPLFTLPQPLFTYPHQGWSLELFSNNGNKIPDTMFCLVVAMMVSGIGEAAKPSEGWRVSLSWSHAPCFALLPTCRKWHSERRDRGRLRTVEQNAPRSRTREILWHGENVVGLELPNFLVYLGQHSLFELEISYM